MRIEVNCPGATFLTRDLKHATADTLTFRDVATHQVFGQVLLKESPSVHSYAFVLGPW
jgi:hypothetical protein